MDKGIYGNKFEKFQMRKSLFFFQSEKETKQRKRFNRSTLSVHSVQFLFIGAPKARCSPERRMCEPLFLRTRIPTRFATSD